MKKISLLPAPSRVESNTSTSRSSVIPPASSPEAPLTALKGVGAPNGSLMLARLAVHRSAAPAPPGRFDVNHSVSSSGESRGRWSCSGLLTFASSCPLGNSIEVLTRVATYRSLAPGPPARVE